MTRCHTSFRLDSHFGPGDPLALLNQHVDFVMMAAEIDRWVLSPSREKGGRPPYPTVLMTRLLVLQQLFNFSDEQMEFQLLGRMSFQRFAGLKNTDLKRMSSLLEMA